VNLHYQPEVIVAHFGDGSRYGVQLIYHYEDRLWGTAGSVGRIARTFTDSFYVFYGDVLTNLDLTSMMEMHQTTRPEATIALYHVSNPTECGIVDLDDNKRIAGFVEKPAPEALHSDLANAGVYVLEPSILDIIPSDVECDFGREAFPRLVAQGRFVLGYTLPQNAFLLDIGTPANYEKANRLWNEMTDHDAH
jgi:NDP-sugar pyrophosphorylase family protein